MLLSKMKVFAFQIFPLFTLSTLILLFGCQTLQKAQMTKQEKIKKRITQKINKPNNIIPNYLWAEEETHKLVNQYRVSLGLAPLILKTTISEVARKHSGDMATGIVPIGHKKFEERIQQIRATFSVIASAENVAWNFSAREPCYTALRGWINSPGHQKNMVGNFNFTGIGVELANNGSYYFTQIFIQIPQ